jgi:hypothetical protein
MDAPPLQGPGREIVARLQAMNARANIMLPATRRTFAVARVAVARVRTCGACGSTMPPGEPLRRREDAP